MLHPASTFFRYDPFDLMRTLAGDYERNAPRAAGGYPPINLWQSAEAAAVTTELPGVEVGDIDISIKDDVLTISGERKAPEAGDKAVWHRRERPYGRFSRAVRLPFRVDPERVEAQIRDGVLRIVMHRRQQDMPRRVEVKAA